MACYAVLIRRGTARDLHLIYWRANRPTARPQVSWPDRIDSDRSCRQVARLSAEATRATPLTRSLSAASLARIDRAGRLSRRIGFAFVAPLLRRLRRIGQIALVRGDLQQHLQGTAAIALHRSQTPSIRLSLLSYCYDSFDDFVGKCAQ